jgi:hypothetical protein
MPSVRTARAPLTVPKATAIKIATGAMSHQGQPRLMSVAALWPKMAIM